MGISPTPSSIDAIDRSRLLLTLFLQERVNLDGLSGDTAVGVVFPEDEDGPSSLEVIFGSLRGFIDRRFLRKDMLGI